MAETQNVRREEAVGPANGHGAIAPPISDKTDAGGKPNQSQLLAFGSAFVSIALMTLLRLFLHRVFGNKYPFITMYVAIAFVGWYGGLWPMLVAVLLAALSSTYFFISPTGSFAITDQSDQLGLVVFLFLSVCLGLITDSQRRREVEARGEEQARRKSEETLATTLRSIGDGVIATDVRGRITFMNHVAATLTGWTEEQAKGKPLSEVFHIVNEKTRAPVSNPVDKVMQTGTIIGLANHTVLIGRDGAEKAIDDSGAPIRSVWGIQGAVLVFRDVTQQRKGTEAQNRLAAIVRSSSDAIIGKTLEGIITNWNPAAERLYGYTEDEVLGQPISILVPASYSDDISGILDRLKAGQRIEHYETKRVTKTGQVLDVELAISPILTEDGEIMGASTVARDITPRKEIEEELERNRRLFERVAKATPNILYLYDLIEQRVLFANPRIGNVLGFSPDSFEGKSGEFITELIHPEDRHSMGDPAKRYEGLEDGEVYEFQYRIRHIDGSYRWLHNRDVVFTRAADGKPHIILGLSEDITDRRRSEEILRESEERLRLALDAGKCGTWDWDIPNDRVHWSERVYDFHGLTPESFGGSVEDFRNLIHPEDLERVSVAIAKAIEEKEPYEAEFRIMRPTGEVRWLTTSGRVHYGASGEAARMLGATIDITDRKRAETELESHVREIEALNARLQRSMGETHHRIKNNLQVITALVEMQIMQNRERQSVPVSQLQRISQHIRALASIHDLLTLQSKNSAEADDLSVKEALEKLLPMIEEMLTGRTISTDVADVRLPIRHGASFVVLLNELVSNSIKHGEGQIELCFRVENGRGLLSVSDEGPGFPSDFNIARSSNTGLELVESLSKWDLEGSVKYENPPQGGATVTVEFPLPT